MEGGGAGTAGEDVGQPEGGRTVQGAHEALRPHQGEAAGIVLAGLQHLRGQGDTAAVPAQDRLHGLVVGGAVAALPFEDHIDRHGGSPGLQEGFSEPSVGRTRPGQGPHSPGPGRHRVLLLEPGSVLQGGVIHGHGHHLWRCGARPAQQQPLLLHSPLPHPQAGAGPTGADPHPGQQAPCSDGPGQGGLHGASELRTAVADGRGSMA